MHHPFSFPYDDLIGATVVFWNNGNNTVWESQAAARFIALCTELREASKGAILQCSLQEQEVC